MKPLKTNAARFLMLEDVQEEHKLILRALQKDGMNFTYHKVDNKKDFLAGIKEFKPDLVIADYNLPSFTGMEALGICKKKIPNTPFIFVTGTLGEEGAVETLKQGAADFVLKSNLSRLPMAVKRALREVEEREQKIQAQKAYAQSELRYQNLLENVPVGICEMTINGDIISVNKKSAELFGYDQEPETKHNLTNFIRKKNREPLEAWLDGGVNGKAFIGNFQSCSKDRLLGLTLIPHFDKNGEKKLIGISEDITEKARSENLIKEKNMLLESLIEAMPDAVYLKDKEQKYVMVNKAFESMFDINSDDVIGKTDTEIIPEGLAKQAEKTDKQVIKLKKLIISAQNFTKQNGDTIIFDTRKNPIFDKKKKVVGIVGVSRDVTFEKLAEDKLKLSEATLLEAERVANIGSWELLPLNGTVQCSHEAARILGTHFSSNSIDYNTLLRSVHRDEKQGVAGAFRNAIMDGEPFVIDHRVIQVDGSVKWVQSKGRPFQNEKGDIEKIVGTIQDITKQKRNEQRLEKNRELLKEAQSIAHLGSFDWNIAENILNCSDEFYNIFQIDQKVFWPTFENYLERIHPYDRELTRKQIFESLTKAETYDIEHRVLLPDNTIKNVRTIGRFKTDDQNQPERLLGTIQDVSDRKKEGDALLAGQELERRRIAMEIHDGIGQMLAATKFNLAALEGMPPEEVEQQLEGIHKILEHTIDEARRITKNLSAKVLQELGLEKAITELCNQAIGIRKFDLKFTCKIDSTQVQPSVETTIYRITQEAINNMVKYSEAKKGSVELYNEENYFVLNIIDDGKGFDTNDPKFKAGNGLTNMKQRAKSLHGYVNMISSVGKGTSILIKIPLETKI